MNATEWQYIASAPKNGTTVRLRNEDTGLTDKGYWTNWAGMTSWDRSMLPEWARDWDGEWSTEFGKGDMTHWALVQGPQL